MLTPISVTGRSQRLRLLALRTRIAAGVPLSIAVQRVVGTRQDSYGSPAVDMTRYFYEGPVRDAHL